MFKNVRKIITVFSLLALTTISFIGCSNTDKNDASKVAEQYIRNLYTVDEKQLTEYNTFIKSSNAEDSRQAFELLLKDFKLLMTDEWYAKSTANGEYIAIVNMGCYRNDYTIQIVQPVLTQRFYDNKENKIGYDYEAKVKIISNKDKKEQIDVAKGYVGLIKENGQWKIYADELYSVPKILIK